ncbi:MAG: alpha/beta hydrolase family protein [Pseudomonadales bacterium]
MKNFIISTMRRRIHEASLSFQSSTGYWLGFWFALMAGLTCFSGAWADESPQQDTGVVSFEQEALEIDPSSFTESNLDWFDSERKRAVPAKLYLPAVKPSAGSLPLVVFSHGIGGSRDGYTYLGRYFAAHGVASLHVQHVGSDRQIWFGNPFDLTTRLNAAAQDAEALHRVQDLRYALDKVLATQEGALIDPRKITAAGHSYGANTTMLISGAHLDTPSRKISLRDPRISAAILISAPPFYGYGDPGKILSNIDIPTLHITATEDVIQIPGYVSGLQDRIEIFKAMGRDRIVPKVLAVFKGGSHSIFTDRWATGGLILNPKVKVATRQLALAFLREVGAGKRGAIDSWRQRHTEIVSAFEKSVP